MGSTFPKTVCTALYLPEVGFEADFGVVEVLGVDLFLLALLGLELIILGPPFLLLLSFT